MSTSWLGADTGLIPLGTGRTSLWYTKVVGEIPRAYTGGGDPVCLVGLCWYPNHPFWVSLLGGP